MELTNAELNTLRLMKKGAALYTGKIQRGHIVARKSGYTRVKHNTQVGLRFKGLIRERERFTCEITDDGLDVVAAYEA